MPTNILLTGQQFCATIPSNATSVVFCNEIAPTGISLTDVSEAQDNSIVAWMDGSTYKVSTQMNEVKVLSNPDSSYMFKGKANLTSIEFNNFDTSKVENMAQTFRECKALTSIDLSNWNVENVLNMEQMFYRCNNLKELNVKDWNPKKCENFNFLCMRCSSLETFDASGWDIGKCKTMDSMFSQCTNLKHFDTKNWKTSSVENMGFAFYGCKSFITLNCEDWDVRNVETFDHLMAHSNMQNFDVSKWEVTSKCENLNAIFHSTQETYIDVTGWDTSNVIAFNQIFDGMVNLEKVDGLETWNTSKGVCFGEMFHSCAKLKEINLSSFDTRKANVGTPISANGSTSYGLQMMFTGCSSLEKLILSENFTRFGNGNIGSEYYAYFPTPSSSNISGADGNWYIFDYAHYAPNDVPDLTAGTYYSSIKLVDEIDVVVKNGSLKKTADAIRTKNGNTKKYKPNEFAEAILLL